MKRWFLLCLISQSFQPCFQKKTIQLLLPFRFNYQFMLPIKIPSLNPAFARRIKCECNLTFLIGAHCIRGFRLIKSSKRLFSMVCSPFISARIRNELANRGGNIGCACNYHRLILKRSSFSIANSLCSWWCKHTNTRAQNPTFEIKFGSNVQLKLLSPTNGTDCL